MELTIVFRHLKSTEAIKDYVTKKVKKLERIVTYPVIAHVTVSLEKNLHCLELACHAEFHDLVAITKTKDLYEAIDFATQKMATQLKKHRDRRKGHASSHVSARKAKKLAQDVKASIPHLGKKSDITVG